ncbi:MAG: MarR family transcriptional regulator [Candidatus Omnitrophota bacterium]
MNRSEQIAKEISVLVPRLQRGMRIASIIPKLTAAQIIVLLSIYEQGMVKAGALSKDMHVSAPTITGIVDRLQRAQYLRRIHDKDDRRAINIKLTEKGQKEAKMILVKIRNRWKAILVRLKESDREHFLETMKKILVVLEKENA